MSVLNSYLRNAKKYFKSIINFSAQKYILSSILSNFILCFFGFISFLFVFHALRIIDLITSGGAQYGDVFNLLKLFILLTFPIALPTSFLISIFLSYRGLLKNNELLAFSSIGMNKVSLLIPTVVFLLPVFMFCYECNTELCPTAHKVSSFIENAIKTKVIRTSIKPGVFFNKDDFTIYIKSKDKEIYSDVFIQHKDGVAFSKTGELEEKDGYLMLNLLDGKATLNRTLEMTSLVSFEKYSIPIPIDKKYTVVNRNNLNQTNYEIRNRSSNLKDNSYKLELTKRLQISFAPVVFAIIFLTFGFKIFDREDSVFNFNLGIVLGIIYWIFYFIFEAVAFKNNNIYYLYITNISYIVFCLLFLTKNRILNFAYRNQLYRKIILGN